ncbi:MAG: hypothetical protein D6687_00680, partial [Acidobacteria bacterium]
LADRAEPGVLDIQELFIGGDTRYGLGRVQKVECSQANKLFDKSVELTGANPLVQTDHVLAHALSGSDAKLLGALEQLSMWDYGKFIPSRLTWAPGSTAKDSPRWRIQEDGFWVMHM